jgi:hypothetical protein
MLNRKKIGLISNPGNVADGLRPKAPVGEEAPLLFRKGLYNSQEDIDTRDWQEILSRPDQGSVAELETLKNKAVASFRTNRPWPKRLQELAGIISKRPVMLCEYGFGYTTYILLEWCIQNDGYLVTVDLPIAPEALLEEEKYAEMYYWGVDRYHTKYPHCVALREHPVSQKRWLWINDDIFAVSEKIAHDKQYREKLFLNEKIHYFYEDAIHDNGFHQDLFDSLKKFMPSGAIFTGDDNCFTRTV